MARPKLPRKVFPVFSNAARVQDSSPYNSTDQFNKMGYNGLILRVKALSEVGTATLDIKVQAYDTLVGAYYDIAGASLAQITANASASIDLIIDPRITAVSNRAVAQPVPYRWRVVATIGDATTEGFTFGVEGEYYD